MIRQPIRRRRRLALGVASFLVLALLYTGMSRRQYARNPSQTTIPGWTQLYRGMVKTLSPDTMDYDGRCWLWVDSKASFARLFTGLGLGVALAVVLGVAMGCYSVVESVLLPPLAYLAKIPPTAMLPVFWVLVGARFGFFVAMIAFGVLPTLAQAVYQAAKKDVPDELIHKASTLGASQAEIIWNVVYRQILPRMLDAIRLQVGPAMVYLIAAEWGSTDVGIGYRVRFQARLLQMNVVYFYLAYLGLVGLTIDFALTWARRKLCPWFGE